jgi:hypothetical protein
VSENALKLKLYKEQPDISELYIICAKANFKLGYLIFAENLT